MSYMDMSSHDNQKQNEEIEELKKIIKRNIIEIEGLKRIIKNKDSEIAQKSIQTQKVFGRAKQQLTEKDVEIRRLTNENVDLKGQIRVAIRVREFDQKAVANFAIRDDNNVKLEQNEYKFEHIFRPYTSQENVFREIRELILCVLHGYNVCLIAYGPTGSGKTFTMRGEIIGSEGVIPRAVRFLLDRSSNDLAVIGWNIKFSASYLEVYNEEVYDLLERKKRCDVKIAGIGSSTNVAGLRKIPIKRLDDVEEIMQAADKQRSTASTNCNTHSSRSHAIFQIYVEGSNSSTDENINCCLNLVDLAGSERAKDSGAEGERFTELKHINQSLMTLKNCIRAQMGQNVKHVPYRDSKLTLLLRSFLGAGSSKTMFIAHCNPNDAAETKRTLEFTQDLRSTNIGRAHVQTPLKSFVNSF